jgi:heat shock protein HslJ
MAASLVGTAWRAVDVDGQPPVEGSEPTIEFSEDRIFGTTGCNRYFAGCTIVGETLSLTPVGMTMMACDGPIGDLEMVFVRVLNAAQTAAVDAEGRLVLGGAGGSAVFVPETASV